MERVVAEEPRALPEWRVREPRLPEAAAHGAVRPPRPGGRDLYQPAAAVRAKDKVVQFGSVERGAMLTGGHIGEMELRPFDQSAFDVHRRSREGGNRFLRLIDYDSEEAEAAGCGHILEKQLTRFVAGHLLTYGSPFPARLFAEIDYVEFSLH